MNKIKKSVLTALVAAVIICLSSALALFFINTTSKASAAGYSVPETQNGSVFKETTAKTNGFWTPWWDGESAWGYNEAENEWFLEGSNEYASFGFKTEENTGSVTFEYKLDYDSSAVSTGEQTFQVLTWDEVSYTDYSETQLSLYPGLTLGNNGWDGQWHKFTLTLPLAQHPDASPQIAFWGYQTPGLYMRVRGLPLPETRYESDITASVAAGCEEMGSILYKGQTAQTQTAKKYNLNDDNIYSITTFKAVANSGCIFIGWQDENGETITTDMTLTTDPNSSVANYKAVFKKPEGTVQDHLNVDKENPVTVLNEGQWGTDRVIKDDRQPWIIDPEHSTEEYIAYMAPNSYVKYPDGIGCYNIGFEFTGSGVLAFDVKFNAKGNDGQTSGVYAPKPTYSSWLVYYYNKPVNYFHDGTPGTPDGFDGNESENKHYKDAVVGWPLLMGNRVRTHENAVEFNIPESYPIKDCIVIDEREKAKGVTVEDIGDDWVRCYIPYTAESEAATNIIYVAYSVRAKYGDQWLDDYASIRNVSFNKGTAYLKTEVTGGAAAGKITYTATNDLTDDAENGKIVPLGTKFKFTAEVNDDCEFYAWKDTEGRIVSYEPTYEYTINEKGKNYKITAVIERKGKYVARNGDDFYEDLATALTKAKPDDNVYILQGKLEGEATVEAGVNLILPLNLRGDYYLSGDNGDNDSQAYISWSTPELEKKYKYREFTIADEAKLTVKGNFYVGGVLHFGPTQTAQAHTSGAYSELINDGEIVIENGGKMDVNGRVTGKGGIEALKGAHLYQPFLILDYSGGNNTQDLFNNSQTPFNRYAMVNIQCKKGYKINFGAMLWGHASLYFMGSATTIDQPFISYETAPADKQSLINLKSGNTSAVCVYEDAHYVGDKNSTNNTFPIGRTTITLYGGAYAGYMSFPMNINTKAVMFSIPYNYNIVLEKGEDTGNYDLRCAFKLMPGATLTVKKGATLNLHANFYVYDGLVQSAMSGKTYPTATELTKAGYTTNANFIVNGTLVIGGNTGSYSYFSGLVQTTEMGAVIDTTHIYDSYLQEREIVDGARTDYDANTSKYKSTPRIYNAAKKTLIRIQGQKRYVSSCASAEPWVLPAKEITYARNLTQAEINQLYKDGKAKPWKTRQELIDEGLYEKLFGLGLQPTWNSDYTSISYQGHQWATGETQPVTLTSGGWMIEHSNHTFEWDEVESGTPSFDVYEKGVSQEIRYCESAGCLEHQTYSILHIEPDLFGWGDDHFGKIHVPYLGREYTSEDLKKIVDPYFEDYEFVDGFSYSINVPTNWNKGLPIKDVSSGSGYYSFQVVYTNGRYYNEYDNYLETYSQVRIIIDKADISELKANGELTAEVLNTYTYNGRVQTPTLSVNWGDIPLVYNVDYTVSCTDINAGTATATVTGAGNSYTGSFTVDFSIAKKPIEITLKNQSAEYTGEDFTPAQNRGDGWTAAENLCSGDSYGDLGITIIKAAGADYAEGGYHLTATSVSDNYAVTFKGEGTENDYAIFTVKRYNLSVHEGEITVGGLENLTYNGSAQTPALTVTAGGKLTLTAESDYSLKWDNNTAASADATVTITGNGNFEGEITKTFSISKYNISTNEGKLTVNGVNDLEYNGTAQQLEITITSEDFSGSATFTAAYKGNKDVSVEGATVTITGNGNFEGEIVKTFHITKKQISVTANDVTVTYGEDDWAAKPLTWHVDEALPGDDAGNEKTVLTVNLTCAARTGANETGYEISGSGTAQNYEITVNPGRYIVNKYDINSNGITVGGLENLTYNGAAQTPALTVKSADGKLTLTVQTDYTLEWNNNTNVSTNEATVTISGTGNYKGTVEKTFSIGKFTITATAEAKTASEGHDLVPLTFTLSHDAFEVEQTEYIKSHIQAYFEDGEDAVKAGKNGSSFKISLKFTGGYVEPANYNVVLNNGANVVYTITDSVYAGITLSGDDVVYDGKSHTLTAQGNIPHGATAKYYYDGHEFTGATDVGDYTITLKITQEGYSEFELTATLKISKFNLKTNDGTVTVGGLTGLVYNGKAQTPEITVTSTKFDGEATVSADWNNNKDVTDVATVTITGTGNFEGTIERTFSIAQKPITVTLIDQSAEYTGSTITPSNARGTGWTAEEVCSGDSDSDLGITITAKEAIKDCKDGGYQLTGASSSKNYKVEFTGEAKFTVNAYNLNNHEGEITVGGLENLTYNGKAQTPEITVNANGLNVTFDRQSLVWSGNTNATTEDKSASVTITGNGNFTGTVTKTFSIAKYNIDTNKGKITVSGLENLTYNGTAQTPQITVTAQGVEGEVTFDEDSLVWGNNTNVSTNGATVKITGTGNFEGEYTATFSISKKAITVILKDQSAEYSGTEPEISQTRGTGWTTDGLCSADGDEVLDIEIAKESGVAYKDGGYKLTATYNQSGNYAVTFKGEGANESHDYATFNITKKHITVTADEITVTYGDDNWNNMPLTWSVAPGELVNGEQKEVLTVNLNRPTVTGANSAGYDITGSGEAANYTISVTPAKYKVNKREVTLTITPATLTVYSGAEQEFTLGYTVASGSIIPGDESGLEITITVKGTNAGFYTATASYNEGSNYTVNFDGRQNALEITQKPITVTIENQTSVYSGAEPAFDGTKFTAEGGIGDEDLKITISKQAGADAGDYPITGVCANQNYKANFVNGVYTVEQKTIPAEEIMIVVTDENGIPYTDAGDGVIRVEFTGAPLTVAAGELSGELTVVTSITQITQTGRYVITATVSEKNYKGSATVTVEAVLSFEETLNALAGLAGDLTPETLTEDDFATLKKISEYLGFLTEEELADERVIPYSELVESWNSAAAADEEVIEIAKKVGDAPISGLFGAVTALLALAYAALKGGKIL